METAKLEQMVVKGWFVGNFEPSLFKTDACEVGVSTTRLYESEALHHHRVATEITCRISGRVRMRALKGDIIVLQPGDATAFEALTDACNVVVKLPALPTTSTPRRGRLQACSSLRRASKAGMAIYRLKYRRNGLSRRGCPRSPRKRPRASAMPWPTPLRQQEPDASGARRVQGERHNPVGSSGGCAPHRPSWSGIDSPLAPRCGT